MQILPSNMDEEADMLHHTLKQQEAALKKAAQRGTKKEHLTAGLKKLICILVLLETSWDAIGAIATCKMALLQGTRSQEPWTPDKIQQVAREGLLLKPSLVEGPLDEEDHEILKAKKWVAELQSTMWIMNQNLKGITLPASAVVKQYMSQWGMGPHKPALTTHLRSVLKQQGQKDWLMQFKRKWHLEVAALPHRPGLQPHQIKDKALKQKWSWAILWKASDQVFMRILKQH